MKKRTNITRTVGHGLLLSSLALLAPGLVACTDESHAEEAADEVDDALDDAADTLEDGADAAEDALEDGAENVEEAVEDLDDGTQ